MGADPGNAIHGSNGRPCANRQIDRERLAATFIQLCETASPSRREGRIAALLRDILLDLGATCREDKSQEQTGSESGNLFFRFEGDPGKEPLFFNCHMDTVEPGVGIRVRRDHDLFSSQGRTILGSDDKAGIAALIEAMRVIRDNKLVHVPLEYVFTTCEEIGLLGAKALDPAFIRARMGYALDSSGTGRVIVRAPASNRLLITIRGVAAHAGLQPEQGVNAIVLAAQGLSDAPCGRINGQSTVNFGVIQGGVASNIVPAEAVIEGEVRSHDIDELASLTRQVEAAFDRAVNGWQDLTGRARGRPELHFASRRDFPRMCLDPESAVLQRLEKASQAIGMPLEHHTAGGGSDANIFSGYGLETAILSTGMTHVHTVDEQVHLDDLVNLTRLLLALMTGP